MKAWRFIPTRDRLQALLAPELPTRLVGAVGGSWSQLCFSLCPPVTPSLPLTGVEPKGAPQKASTRISICFPRNPTRSAACFTVTTPGRCCGTDPLVC